MTNCYNEAFSAYVHSDFHFDPKRHFGYNMLKRNLPEKYGQYTIQELHEKFDLAYVNIWKPIVGKNSDGQIYGNHLCIIDSRTIDESDLVKYQYDGGNGRAARLAAGVIVASSQISHESAVAHDGRTYTRIPTSALALKLIWAKRPFSPLRLASTGVYAVVFTTSRSR